MVCFGWVHFAASGDWVLVLGLYHQEKEHSSSVQKYWSCWNSYSKLNFGFVEIESNQKFRYLKPVKWEQFYGLETVFVDYLAIFGNLSSTIHLSSSYYPQSVGCLVWVDLKACLPSVIETLYPWSHCLKFSSFELTNSVLLSAIPRAFESNRHFDSLFLQSDEPLSNCKLIKHQSGTWPAEKYLQIEHDADTHLKLGLIKSHQKLPLA